MNDYRITWGGIYDCTANTEEEAINQFINYIKSSDIDDYGRNWKDLIDIENLGKHNKILKRRFKLK